MSCCWGNRGQENKANFHAASAGLREQLASHEGLRRGGQKEGAVHWSTVPFASHLPVQVRLFWGAISSMFQVIGLLGLFWGSPSDTLKG